MHVSVNVCTVCYAPDGPVVAYKLMAERLTQGFKEHSSRRVQHY